MIRSPPRTTRTVTLIPYTTLVGSDRAAVAIYQGGGSGHETRARASLPGEQPRVRIALAGHGVTKGPDAQGRRRVVERSRCRAAGTGGAAVRAVVPPTRRACRLGIGGGQIGRTHV